jgi:signal-transduction protein with cAMP-binding, CBS, and nucleotidyltransferase domain
METGIKVMDAMTVNPVVTNKEMGLRECAKLMLKKGVGSVIVVEGPRMVGIITEKDFVGKVIAKKKDPNKMKVKDIMTKRIRTIEPNVDIYKAIVKMRKKKVKKLPVVVRKELVGMLTMNDIIRVQPNLLDYLIEKFHVKEMRQMNKRQRNNKEKYIEGACESCGDYAQLYDVEGQLLCEDCKDEKGQ